MPWGKLTIDDQNLLLVTVATPTLMIHLNEDPIVLKMMFLFTINFRASKNR
jgi:hypothetical protein